LSNGILINHQRSLHPFQPIKLFEIDLCTSAMLIGGKRLVALALCVPTKSAPSTIGNFGFLASPRSTPPPFFRHRHHHAA
jgi:hypothetical protein